MVTLKASDVVADEVEAEKLTERVYRTTPLTPAEKLRDAEAREKFKDAPTLEQLQATGEFGPAMNHGEYMRHVCRLREAEQELCETVLRHTDLKEQVKQAGKDVSNAAQRLARLRADVDYTPAVNPLAAQEIEKPATDLWGEPVAPVVEQTDPEAWKFVSIAELGMTPKLAEKFNEAGVTNMEQMEQLRASRDGLRSIKGVSRSTADRVEEMILAWLTKHRDATALKVVSPEPSANGDGDGTDTEAIEARAGQLKTGQENSLAPTLEDHGYWESGKEAFGLGHLLADCPLVKGPEQDDWIRGWLEAVVLANYSGLDEADEAVEEVAQ